MLKKSFSCILSLLLIVFAFSSCGLLDEVASDVDVSQGSVSSDSVDASENLSSGDLSKGDLLNTESFDSIDNESSAIESEESGEESRAVIDENGVYTGAADVGLYIHTYGKLPNNFITKNEARSLGWEGGGLEEFAPGKCIGGDRFGNYEELLPEKDGRFYTECDIDTLGKSSRGAKRIVFSNDGLVYYTDDHYESFTLLYGEE